MRKTMSEWLWILLGLFASGLAHAEITQSDLQITGRALSFLENPPSGEVNVGIVYVSGSPQSQRDAETLQRLLGPGLKVGNVTLKPVMVNVGDVGRARVGMFFLTAGLGPAAKGVADASSSRHIPCVTTDIAQVRAGLCTMGVRSQPKIEILVNRTAANASQMTFSNVFRMMISEI